MAITREPRHGERFRFRHQHTSTPSIDEGVVLVVGDVKCVLSGESILSCEAYVQPVDNPRIEFFADYRDLTPLPSPAPVAGLVGRAISTYLLAEEERDAALGREAQRAFARDRQWLASRLDVPLGDVSEPRPLPLTLTGRDVGLVGVWEGRWFVSRAATEFSGRLYDVDVLTFLRSAARLHGSEDDGRSKWFVRVGVDDGRVMYVEFADERTQQAAALEGLGEILCAAHNDTLGETIEGYAEWLAAWPAPAR